MNISSAVNFEKLEVKLSPTYLKLRLNMYPPCYTGSFVRIELRTRPTVGYAADNVGKLFSGTTIHVGTATSCYSGWRIVKSGSGARVFYSVHPCRKCNGRVRRTGGGKFPIPIGLLQVLCDLRYLDDLTLELLRPCRDGNFAPSPRIATVSRDIEIWISKTFFEPLESGVRYSLI